MPVCRYVYVYICTSISQFSRLMPKSNVLHITYSVYVLYVCACLYMYMFVCILVCVRAGGSPPPSLSILGVSQ